MANAVSTLGIVKTSTNTLSNSQAALSRLSQQLTSNVKSSNLSDYTIAEAEKLMSFTSTIDQQKGFLSVITTITSRIDVYDAALDGVEDTTSNMISSLLTSSVYNPETNASLAAQIESAMEQIEYYLNQQIGTRYLFAGARYGQAPVDDISALPSPPTEAAPYVVAPPAVPSYDIAFDPFDPTAAVPAANSREIATIDSNRTLTYGINSNSEGFQQIIMGLRWAYAATQDPANYNAHLSQAQTLLNEGLNNTRAVHTDLSNASRTLAQTSENINRKITSLETQIGDIQNVDLNEVAIKITTMQAQLQASYSAVSSMINLSILDYL